MICICGNDLGDITIETTGLCSNCNRSLWIQAAKAREINPQQIAIELNEAGRGQCDHQQTLCISRCGVMLIEGTWLVVPQQRRDEWFRKALEPAKYTLEHDKS